MIKVDELKMIKFLFEESDGEANCLCDYETSQEINHRNEKGKD